MTPLPGSTPVLRIRISVRKSARSFPQEEETSVLFSQWGLAFIPARNTVLWFSHSSIIPVKAVLKHGSIVLFQQFRARWQGLVRTCIDRNTALWPSVLASPCSCQAPHLPASLPTTEQADHLCIWILSPALSVFIHFAKRFLFPPQGCRLSCIGVAARSASETCLKMTDMCNTQKYLTHYSKSFSINHVYNIGETDFVIVVPPKKSRVLVLPVMTCNTCCIPEAFTTIT